MSVKLSEFFRLALESGLVTAEQLRALRDRLSPEERSTTAGVLARRMIKEGLLTSYQASRLLEGRSDGLVLGNYLVLDKIGEGGMGQVFRAQHRRMKRSVAIKTLPAESLASPDKVQRFQREVEAAARLAHPHIVTAFDAAEANGTHFLVMELVDGEDLGRLARRGPLPTAQAVDYIIQAARGLEYAHGKGIVHRDIKPQNLLLDKSGTVKVLDMGLVRLDAGDKVEATVAAGELTADNQILGTIDYMSPEQAESRSNIDRRTDIYSLGCTLYRLLTGRVPYDGDSAVQKLLAHRVQPIPSLREARPDVPQRLDEVFRKMVAKLPEERYETMGEVIAELEAAVGAGQQGASAGETESRSVDTAIMTFVSGLPHSGSIHDEPPQPSATGSPPSAVGRMKKPRRKPWQIAVLIVAIFSPTVIFAGAVAIYLSSSQAESGQPGKLVLDWPEDERQDAKLIIDNEAQAIQGKKELTFELAEGPHKVGIMRRGYEPIFRDIEIEPGGRQTIKPSWKKMEGPRLAGGDGGQGGFDPDREQNEALLMKPWIEARGQRRQELEVSRVKREEGLAALRKLADEAGTDPAQLAALTEQVREFRRRNAGTKEAAEAGALLALAPAPADALKRDAISDFELRVAGSGDAIAAPKNLVAVLGDSRLRHTGYIYAVALSPDGKLLATGGQDRQVRLWTSDGGDLVATLEGHTNEVRCLAFSSNGEQLASGSYDGTVRLWNVGTRRENLVLRSTANILIDAVDFSPDGEHVVAGAQDSRAHLWNASTGQLIKRFDGHESYVRAVAFAPNNKAIVSGDALGIIHIWYVDGDAQKTLAGHGSAVSSLCILSDGTSIISGGQDGTIRFWNPASGEQQQMYSWETANITGLSVTGDGETLASGSQLGVRLWNLPTDRVRLEWTTPSAARVAISQSGETLATCGGLEAELWETDVASRPRLVRPGHRHAAHSVAISADGTTLVSGGSDRMARTWSLADGTETRVLEGHGNSVLSAVLTPDGRRVISADQSGGISVWNAATGRSVQELDWRGEAIGAVSALDVSPDGSLLAAACADRTVRLWSLATMLPTHKCLGHTGGVSDVVFSPDGSRILSVSLSGELRIFDAGDGTQRLVASAHPGGAACLALSPDGDTLATGGVDGTVKLWSLDQPEQTSDLVGHSGGVQSLAFSPDGKTLVSAATASGNRSGELMIWDVASKSARRRIQGPQGSVHDVVFDSTGRYLAAAHENGAVYLLRLANAGE